MNKTPLSLVIINDMLWGGGRERRIVQLISGLNKLGVNDIYLILLDDRVDYPEVFNFNVKVIKILRKNRRDVSVFLKLYRILKEIGPTLVNPWSYMSVFYAAPICALLGLPCVGAFVVDAKPPARFSINWVGMHLGFILCRKVVGNSIAGHEAYRTPMEKRAIIYNGFDQSRLNHLIHRNSYGEPIQIAMIGRLDRQKDYRTYLDGLAILQHRGVNFRAYIVGQGDQIGFLKEYAENHCAGSVLFTGFIRDIDSFIANIDIGVLCTNPIFHAEGISNAIMEIMAQGKPVIATNGGGTPEIVRDGHNGFLVPAGDPQILADRIQDLCQNSGLRKTLGDNATETIATKFNLPTMASEFYRTYYECL